MLVLSRKESERLVIDGNIVITIVRISGGSVRLGIEAPADVSIKREELLTRPAALKDHVARAVLAHPHSLTRAKSHSQRSASVPIPLAVTKIEKDAGHLSG